MVTLPTVLFVLLVESVAQGAWPTYPAKDYAQSNHPALTAKQRKVISYALATVKPCQRRLLRYGFPVNPSFGLPFILFFEPRPLKATHVFWTNGAYVLSDGEVFVSPEGWPRVSPDIQNDIKERGCD